MTLLGTKPHYADAPSDMWTITQKKQTLNGAYRLRIHVRDEAGNESESWLSFTAYAERVGAMTFSGDAFFTPNGDGNKDVLTGTVQVSGSEAQYLLKLWVASESGRFVRELLAQKTVTSKDSLSVMWEGRDSQAVAVEEDRYWLRGSLSALSGETLGELATPVLLMRTRPTVTMRPEQMPRNPLTAMMMSSAVLWARRCALAGVSV